MAMIEWGSPDWGGRVHEAENGSWVPDKHDKDEGKAKGKAKAKGADRDKPTVRPAAPDVD
jgi:hypothetical protein